MAQTFPITEPPICPIRQSISRTPCDQIYVASGTQDFYITLGGRETNTTAPIGGNGGTTGGIEWIGATELENLSFTPVEAGAVGPYLIYLDDFEQVAVWAICGNVELRDFEGDVTGVSMSLTNGDIDGDNEVTLFDFGVLVRNFGAIGDE